jgi:hypothetical protein
MQGKMQRTDKIEEGLEEVLPPWGSRLCTGCSSALNFGHRSLAVLIDIFVASSVPQQGFTFFLPQSHQLQTSFHIAFHSAMSKLCSKSRTVVK